MVTLFIVPNFLAQLGACAQFLENEGADGKICDYPYQNGGDGRGISEEYARGPGKLRGQGFRVSRIMKALRWNNKIRGKVEIKLYLCVSFARRKVRKGADREDFAGTCNFFLLISTERNWEIVDILYLFIFFFRNLIVQKKKKERVLYSNKDVWWIYYYYIYCYYYIIVIIILLLYRVS